VVRRIRDYGRANLGQARPSLAKGAGHVHGFLSGREHNKRPCAKCRVGIGAGKIAAEAEVSMQRRRGSRRHDLSTRSLSRFKRLDAFLALPVLLDVSNPRFADVRPFIRSGIAFMQRRMEKVISEEAC
jgi:hypothetical protein